MDPIDHEIRKRLEKLREPMQQVPSADELHERLRKLKDLPSGSSSALTNKYVLFPKPRSDFDQVNDLINQVTDEVTLRSNYCKSTSVNEIEKRLQKLKSDDEPRMAAQSRSRPEQPRESDTKVLLKKILAEARMEKETEQRFPNLAPQLSSGGKVGKEEKMDYSDSDEEFCTICDRHPKWVCSDCDKHLFCARCFNEYHEDIGEYHRKKPFVSRGRFPVDSDDDSD